MPRGKPDASKAGKTSAKAPTLVQSVRDLASRLKKSHTAVAGWVKHPSWTFGHGPWAPSLLPEIELWARRTLSPDPAATPGAPQPGRRKLRIQDLDPKQRADVTAKIIKARREQFKFDQEQGLFHRVDECEAKRVQRVLELKNALLQLPEGLPFGQEVRDVVRGRVVELLTRFSQGR